MLDFGDLWDRDDNIDGANFERFDSTISYIDGLNQNKISRCITWVTGGAEWRLVFWIRPLPNTLYWAHGDFFLNNFLSINLLKDAFRKANPIL